MFKYNERSTARYNALISKGVEEVTHFIYLHYLTKRNDTEFWQTFRERHPAPQKFEEMLQLIYENNLREVDLEGWTIEDYLEICNGLDIFKQPIDMMGYENLVPSVAEYKEMNDTRIRDSTNITKHTDFLAGLYGPERLGSPFGLQCHCEEPKFHRTG